MKSEKFTPIALTEEQKAYDKLAKKEASNLNNVFENLAGSITGKGFNKEDIMRVDANTENELRDQGYSAKEKLERTKNSTLEYSKTKIDNETHSDFSGRINGHNVVIHTIWYRAQSGCVPYVAYSGTIDGLELSDTEAYNIYSKYIDVAKERTDKIISSKYKTEIEKQNIIKKEKEKEAAIAKEKANVKAKEDAVIKTKVDGERAVLLKDLGL